ncbi:MAG: ThuA domain-containing protein [Clostridia bacterium]|nr:ThuA domain-containing protein [Clostridia bacterium]
MIRVLVWCEHYQDREDEAVRAVYPEFMHNAIAGFLSEDADLSVKTATLFDENCGITDEILAETDVIIWWGHMLHHEVPDEIVDKVQEFVLNGGGFIPLHSAHFCKPFIRLMGTSCGLCVEGYGKHVINCVRPAHPINRGLPEVFELPEEEKFTEFYDVPQPDELIYISGYESGRVFRSGCAYHRGRGKVFYFQPGHESFPIYRDANIQKVIRNAVYWVAPNKD